MTSPITPEMVEAAARAIAQLRGHKNPDQEIATIRGPAPVWMMYLKEARAALEAALPFALAAAPAKIGLPIEVKRALEAKGFVAGVEAAARVVEGAPVKEPNKIALVKYIRALRPRPPAAPVESEG
jgi:hypothetical protein